MNRAKALYRVFVDEDDGSALWYEVLPDNSPGAPLGAGPLAVVEAMVGEAPWNRTDGSPIGEAPWAEHFWKIAAINFKATIYADA